MSARALPSLLLICLLLSSCTLLPARRPFGPTATVPAPTATPLPLLIASGGRASYISPAFSAPFSGWSARWSYDCRQVPASAGTSRWQVTMVARHTHRRQQPAAQTILLVRAAAAGRRLPARGHGTTSMTARGTVYIAVEATKGCLWQVEALPWP